MNIAFMGTPEFAKESLKKLIEQQYNIKLVVTNKDKKSGRGMEVRFSPVKELALENNIEIMQPDTLKDGKVLKRLEELNIDLIIVVAYGKIIPKEIIEFPKYGCINVHGSLLPKYRGAAPIQWAVINGEEKTGITTMYINEGLDTGDMILKKEISIGKSETTKELFERMQKLGAEALSDTLIQIKEGTVKTEKQDDKQATYAPMIKKEMANLDFNKNAKEVVDLIRGLNDFLVARAKLGEHTYKIWKAIVVEDDIYTYTVDEKIKEEIEDSKEGGFITFNYRLFVKCKDKFIEILEIQAPSKKKMNVGDYLRGNVMV